MLRALGWCINIMFHENIEWYKSKGADDSEINQLQSAINFELPEAYINLLRFSNGGEASLRVQPLYFVLDSIQDALSYFESDASKAFSGYFIFGGNGGGELLAIEQQTSAVVCIDSCNSNTEEVIRIASTFDEFLSYIE